jgi:nicotinamidase/pyrazinamidase
VQVDFCPGGTLAVKHGDRIIPQLNSTIRVFDEAHLPIYFTRDWHPRNHCSFVSQGGIWPSHCVKNTGGAKFHPELQIPLNATIVNKGTKAHSEAYSGFQGTVLAKDLEKLNVEEVFVGGLATDYCIKNTVLDALDLGFSVVLLTDCIRGVDVKSGDSVDAVKLMVGKGAKPATSEIARRSIVDIE